jgi:hypothetical protein
VYVDIKGDRTGRTWRYHLTRDVVVSSGERYRATAVDDGSVACVHRVGKGELWQDDLARVRSAIELASRPEVAGETKIRRLLDVRDVPSTTGEWGYPGALFSIWEWGELSLKPDEPLDIAADVETSVRTALAALHAIGVVHLDVAPNNVLRVDGAWKLADLDISAAKGAPVPDRNPPPRYMHPERREGVPACEEFDLYGLEQIVSDLRAMTT